MDDYKKNYKMQNTLLKKYGKYIRKVIIGILIDVVGIFVIPSIGLGDILVKIWPLLNKIVQPPYDAAATITVWSSIITSVVGTIKGAVNGIKAHKTKVKLRDAIEEQSDLVDFLNLELEKAKTENKKQTEELSNIKENSKLKSKSKKIDNFAFDTSIFDQSKEEVAYQEDDRHKIKR